MTHSDSAGDKVHVQDRKDNVLKWSVLLALYLVIAFAFSILQPLGRTPDESAHMQYVKFLANNLQFPMWQAQGGGEAGYEAQHPPLYYALGAVVYKLSLSLEERWRWHLVRWATITIGIGLFFICRRFFKECLELDELAFAATATTLLMPLTILYTGYVNPDGLTVLLVTLALYLTWKTSTQSASLKQVALLGLCCGLAVLTKLSGLPAFMIAFWAHARYPGANGLLRRVRLSVLTATFLLTCGWWYVRNIALYGEPFIHTEGKMGSGWQAAIQGSIPHFAFLTWRETFLSTWAQRGWFPPGLWEWGLYGIVCGMIGLAAYGLIRKRQKNRLSNLQPSALVSPSALKIALNLSGLLIVLIFLGQQWAYWTMDVEFNAGGRYMLASLAGISLLLISGISTAIHKSRVVLHGWIAVLMLMNLVSAWHIDTELNPRYAPGWEMFHFPAGEEP